MTSVLIDGHPLPSHEGGVAERRSLSGVRVLLLGWAGSSAKDLRPIQALYEDLGATVIARSSDIVRLMGTPFRDRWPVEGQAIRELLSSRGEGRTITHTFSNAGFVALDATLQAMSAGERDSMLGHVFDSGPGLPEKIAADYSVTRSAMAVLPILLRSLGRPPQLEHPILSPILRGILFGWHYLSPHQIRRFEDAPRSVASMLSKPALLLYSDVDRLVDAIDVEHFGGLLTKRGISVTQHRFEDSPHVAHHRVHKDDYRASMLQFLNGLEAGAHPG